MKAKIGYIIIGLFVLLSLSILWVVIRGTPVSPQSDPKAALTPNVAFATTPAHSSFFERTASELQDGIFLAPRKPFEFGLDHVSFLQSPIFGRSGQPLWEILASFIYIVLAFCVAKLLDLFIHAKLKKWAERSETKVDDLLLNLLHGPTTLLTFVVLVHYGLYLSSLFSIILKVLVAVSLTYLAVKCIDLLIIYWRERASSAVVDKAFDEMLLPVVSRSLKVFIIVVGVLVTSDNLGMNIKSVLASLSIGGLALGLAAQDTLANVFGAVAVFIDKPFHIGDRIKLDVIEGTVESIGLRSTRVRNDDGYLITIPNKTMGNAIITNISRRPTIKTDIQIGLPYSTPVEKIRLALEIIQKTYQTHPLTHDVSVELKQFGDSGLKISITHFCKTRVYKDYVAAMQEMNLTLKRRFDEEKIDFAFPSRTVYFKHNGAPEDNGTSGAAKSSVPLRL